VIAAEGLRIVWICSFMGPYVNMKKTITLEAGIESTRVGTSHLLQMNILSSAHLTLM
jgi:hypothetical protein